MPRMSRNTPCKRGARREDARHVETQAVDHGGGRHRRGERAAWTSACSAAPVPAARRLRPPPPETAARARSARPCCASGLRRTGAGSSRFRRRRAPGSGSGGSGSSGRRGRRSTWHWRRFPVEKAALPAFMPRQPAEFQRGGVVVENALGVDAGRIHESVNSVRGRELGQ